MKEEATKFLLDDEYKDEREVILYKTIFPGYILASLVLSCLNKIDLVEKNG